MNWLFLFGFLLLGSLMLLAMRDATANKAEAQRLRQATIDLQARLDRACEAKPNIVVHIPKTAQYSLITPARWKSSSERVQWMRDLLAQGPFMDVLSILQSTAIQPPSQGFDPAYELGRVHGLQLAVRTMLSLSHPEEEPARQPIADYNASTEANKAGVRLDDEEAQSALDGTYDAVADPIS